ncbi:MAG: thermonuclease family protein [Bacilli bacterium]|nr:thermonuclease family protein [Bacilli bacterium]
MKINKISLIIFCFFLFIPNIKANEKIPVTFSKCVDGDTAKFELNNKIITARFLAIDTPETKHPKKGEEPWGKEASDFTCNSLKNAKNIELEYDNNSNKTDKYDRHLVWVFIDNELLQDNLIKKGYAEVAYLYGDYKYTPLLQDHEKMAQKDKLGIWGNAPESKINYWFMGLGIIALIIIYFLASKKTKRKIKNKIKHTLKKEIQSRL